MRQRKQRKKRCFALPPWSAAAHPAAARSTIALGGEQIAEEIDEIAMVGKNLRFRCG